MSADANETKSAESAGGDAAAVVPAGATATAKEAPTEQQESKPGLPKRFAPGQTVCNEKNEKGKLCNGHLKQMQTAHASAVHLRGDDALHKCQTCGALYMGPPLGHVRDTRKQKRYVERDLTAILQAAGGTLPAYSYPNPAIPANAATITNMLPGKVAAPTSKSTRRAAADAATQSDAEASARAAAVAEVPDQTAAQTSADSSSEADRHRPAAEAQAATGQASAAPMSPAAATASPAAGAETPADLAPEASTELTPGAPKDERNS